MAIAINDDILVAANVANGIIDKMKGRTEIFDAREVADLTRIEALITAAAASLPDRDANLLLTYWEKAIVYMKKTA